MNPFVRIGIFASAVVVVIVAFAQSFWLGLLAVLLLIAWLLYRGRAPLYMLLGNELCQGRPGSGAAPVPESV